MWLPDEQPESVSTSLFNWGQLFSAAYDLLDQARNGHTIPSTNLAVSYEKSSCCKEAVNEISDESLDNIAERFVGPS